VKGSTTKRTSRLISDDEREKNIIKNVKTMIKYLFTTKYPNAFNNYDSYSYIFDKGEQFALTQPYDVYDSVLSNYTYLKINGKVYTVAKTLWLNDVLNHPKYRKDLVVATNRFNEWREEKAEDIEKEINSLYDKILTKVEADKTAAMADIDDFAKNPISASGRYNITPIIKKMTEEMKKLYNLNKPASGQKIREEDIKIILNSTDYISRQITEYGNRITIPQALRKRLEVILQSAKRGNILDAILKKYFHGNEINTNFKEDDPAEQRVFESEFKRYVDYVNKIKDFVRPNTESSNKRFQRMITDYSQSATTVLSSFLTYIYEKYYAETNAEEPAGLKEGISRYNSEKDGFNQLLYVGIGVSENPKEGTPKYEMYLQCDVIGGELNIQNQLGIKCVYDGESLGRQYEELTNVEKRNKWLINYDDRIYVDVGSGKPVAKKEASDNEPKDIKKDVKVTGKPVEGKRLEKALKRGGKTRRRIRKNKKNETKRVRFSRINYVKWD